MNKLRILSGKWDSKSWVKLLGCGRIDEEIEIIKGQGGYTIRKYKYMYDNYGTFDYTKQVSEGIAINKKDLLPILEGYDFRAEINFN